MTLEHLAMRVTATSSRDVERLVVTMRTLDAIR
jgi:hypothetical protein